MQERPSGKAKAPMLRMAPDTLEEGVWPVRSQVTPSPVWVSRLQEPEARRGHLSLSHSLVTQQSGPPRVGAYGDQEKNPFDAPVGKSIPNVLQTQGLQSQSRAGLASRA